MKIDKTKAVLVTGANGYVASWLVKKLLEEGVTVHAAVRNSEDEEKMKHLLKMGEESKGIIKFFESDLLKPGSYDDAIKGCELVYHTASPFTTNFKDPQKELIDPAVKGTENVLSAANKEESVKRVIVTSSCAAIYTDCIDTVNAPEGKLTEDVWNETASLDYQPYSYSKTLAERKAWEMQKAQNRWDLVTINMSLVLGPAYNIQHVTSESINILKMLGSGEMKMGAPKLGAGIVDAPARSTTGKPRHRSSSSSGLHPRRKNSSRSTPRSTTRWGSTPSPGPARRARCCGPRLRGKRPRDC